MDYYVGPAPYEWPFPSWCPIPKMDVILEDAHCGEMHTVADVFMIDRTHIPHRPMQPRVVYYDMDFHQVRGPKEKKAHAIKIG